MGYQLLLHEGREVSGTSIQKGERGYCGRRSALGPGSLCWALQNTDGLLANVPLTPKEWASNLGSWSLPSWDFLEESVAQPEQALSDGKHQCRAHGAQLASAQLENPFCSRTKEVTPSVCHWVIGKMGCAQWETCSYTGFQPLLFSISPKFSIAKTVTTRNPYVFYSQGLCYGS